MVAKLVYASALVALAGAAQGASFDLNLADAGGIGGALGNAITWTPASQASYAASSGVVAPSADDIDGNAKLAQDNYFGMDSLGRSEGGDPSTKGDGYTSNQGLVVVAGSGFGNGSAFGVWGVTTPVTSGHGLSAGADSIFLMNITLRAGSSDPTTAGLLVQLRDAGTNNSANSNFVFGTVLFGAANASNNGGQWGQSYYLDFKKTTVTTAQTNATFNGGSTYQIFIVAAVPTPGAAGIAGLAGLVSLRRRRA